jgi:hypothetical protein
VEVGSASGGPNSYHFDHACISVYPVSAILADRDVMLCIKPGEHGSTYGGCACISTHGIRFLFNIDFFAGTLWDAP